LRRYFWVDCGHWQERAEAVAQHYFERLGALGAYSMRTDERWGVVYVAEEPFAPEHDDSRSVAAAVSFSTNDGQPISTRYGRCKGEQPSFWPSLMLPRHLVPLSPPPDPLIADDHWH
jgi:hypothetical protein